jgi:hypothetical protein
VSWLWAWAGRDRSECGLALCDCTGLAGLVVLGWMWLDGITGLGRVVGWTFLLSGGLGLAVPSWDGLGVAFRKLCGELTTPLNPIGSSGMVFCTVP